MTLNGFSRCFLSAAAFLAVAGSAPAGDAAALGDGTGMRLLARDDAGAGFRTTCACQEWYCFGKYTNQRTQEPGCRVNCPQGQKAVCSCKPQAWQDDDLCEVEKKKPKQSCKCVSL